MDYCGNISFMFSICFKYTYESRNEQFTITNKKRESLFLNTLFFNI
jgi:hypothetical protein